jgi:hypothetical protein
LFSLLFIFIFWLDFRFASITYQLFIIKNNIHIPNFGLLDFLPTKIRLFTDYLFLIFTIFSFACYLLASASHFKKNVLLKTIILFGVFGFITFLVNVVLSHLFLPNEVTGFEVKVFKRNLDNKYTNIQICIYAIGIFSWLFFIPLSYLKLKEKQV